MSLITLVKGLLSLASAIVGFMRDKKLYDAGATEAILKGIREADDAIIRANNSRHNLVGVSDDKQNRDNKQ